MSCNCNNSTPCNNCSTGVSCGCPPDYSMMPVLPECGCCPDGYSWSGPTPNYPNGVCTNGAGTTTDPIDCEQCEEAISAQCVTMPGVDCLGIKDGDNLSDVFKTLFCSPAFWRMGLEVIATDVTTLNGFCNLVASCGPVPGSSTPVPGPVIWTIP